jgi:osmotically-inducible protein OsmY
MNNMADWTEAEKARRRGKLVGAEAESKRTLAEKTAKMGGLLKTYDMNTASAKASAFEASSSSSSSKSDTTTASKTTTPDADATTLQDKVDAMIENAIDGNQDKKDTSTSDADKPDLSVDDDFVNELNGQFSGVGDSEADQLTQDLFGGGTLDDDDAMQRYIAAKVDTEIASKVAGQLLNLPKAVDWRKVRVNVDGEEVRVLGKVKDQGTCGR